MRERRVLIVEDDAASLRLARDLLSLHGWATVEARTGAEAVELAGRWLPSVILMDIHLPDMEGTSALSLLRDRPATQAIPVVALTASAMKGDRERFLRAGFDAYLAKPIDVATFPGEIAAVVDGGTWEGGT